MRTTALQSCYLQHVGRLQCVGLGEPQEQLQEQSGSLGQLWDCCSNSRQHCVWEEHGKTVACLVRQQVQSPEELMMGRVLMGCLTVQLGVRHMSQAPVARLPLKIKAQMGRLSVWLVYDYLTSRNDLRGIVCCST